MENKEKFPKVSVVIPTHNRPDYVIRAVDSVLAQTYKDYEIIVVDDGDDPSAKKVVEKFLTLPNFTYLETKKNEGAPVARNIGIKAARGECVAFLDDDDRWVPEKLKKQISLFESSSEEVGFVFSAVENIYNDRTFISSVNDKITDFSKLALTRFKGFLTSTLLVKKHILVEVGGFDEVLLASQEPDLIIRITRKHHGIAINEPLVLMNMSSADDHIGGNMMRRIKGREMLLDKHKALYIDNEAIWATQLFRLALMYREVRMYRRSSYFFFYSLKYKFSYVALLHSVKCVFLSFFLERKNSYVSILDPIIKE